MDSSTPTVQAETSYTLTIQAQNNSAQINITFIIKLQGSETFFYIFSLSSSSCWKTTCNTLHPKPISTLADCRIRFSACLYTNTIIQSYSIYFLLKTSAHNLHSSLDVYDYLCKYKQIFVKVDQPLH